ncbi:YbjC family protein [Proteus mirabilis]|uniref:YbjC family protein n=1 Tax=Proteus mirabilis TaxID=584 RepID=UPI0016273C48|nr:YbjC family protein [Proteus mirabilis]MBB6724259.1 YbjC family protein [Proteus mirabilis]MCL8587269.1 YbjC family protein [Proteus mirabilis]MCL8595873.1 YbjC family protein [Proteus mirabilis]MCT8195484.1 YbjC family protein [Proteus mirabilis]MDF7345213.1 YbjC family protein [Proteus mirabilis]
MEKPSKRDMKTLSDMPKPIIIIELIGIMLLVIAYLYINQYMTSPEWLTTYTGQLTLVVLGVLCMIPPAIHIVWRAIYRLTFLGIDTKVTENKKKKSHNEK